MEELLKKPLVALALLIVGLFAIRFIFSLAINLFGLILLAAVVLFFVNPKFKKVVMVFMKRIFVK